MGRGGRLWNQSWKGVRGLDEQRITDTCNSKYVKGIDKISGDGRVATVLLLNCGLRSPPPKQSRTHALIERSFLSALNFGRRP